LLEKTIPEPFFTDYLEVFLCYSDAVRLLIADSAKNIDRDRRSDLA